MIVFSFWIDAVLGYDLNQWRPESSFGVVLLEILWRDMCLTLKTAAAMLSVGAAEAFCESVVASCLGVPAAKAVGRQCSRSLYPSTTAQNRYTISCPTTSQ